MTLPASGAIAFSCINTELGYSSTAAVSLNDSAVRTLFGQASGAVDMNTGHGKSNTSVPGAPTSVSGSATSSSAISVSFSAPACNGHLTIDSYQAISSPGCITASASASPISVTGLSASTAYTFRVRAHNSKGYGSYSSASASVSTQSVRGCASYTTPGSFTLVLPAGVTSVSVVAVGGGYCGGTGRINYNCDCGYFGCAQSGGGGGGGALVYNNNASVGTATNFNINVGRYSDINGSYIYPTNGCCAKKGCACSSLAWARGGQGSFACAGGYKQNCSTVVRRAQMVEGRGGGGGDPYSFSGYLPYIRQDISTGVGGGGAGGYAGTGGQGANRQAYYRTLTTPTAGANGGGGGGGGGWNYLGRGGGGVSIYGQGSSGAAGQNSPSPGTFGYANIPTPGGGGSGGSDGHAVSGSTDYNSTTSGNGNGGAYGGGGGGMYDSIQTASCFGAGSPYISRAGTGAVRIVWPGSTRQFPSTDVA